ncbi:MAG: GNAT family N-acetyltransferase [Actinobacteria bacterium]|jgi:GNAT superfamily N-acetyltransferase|nr:GNAT family N-acetyltransferase [Actinomycetota bacterium]
MSIKIRPIELGDKERWLELFKEYIVFYKSSLTDAQFELTWKRLNSEFNIKGLVAEVDNKIVGFTHYIWRPSTWEVEDFCYLEDLYVDPKNRKSGVGRALIKAVEEIASAKGSKRLYWTTAPDNETARKLYDKVAITDRVQYKIFLNK